MKYLLLTICYVIICVIIYAAISFANLEINFIKWKSDDRIVLAFLCGIASIIYTLLTFCNIVNHYDEQNIEK